MRIVSLSFKNRKTGWNIHNLSFNGLTLLVGASGVGKTQILRAITDIAGIAKGKSLNGVEWSISFKQDGHNYLWNGAFSVTEEQYETASVIAPLGSIEYERLERDGNVIIDRTTQGLIFNGTQTVKLELEKSAISLLKHENDIAPIAKGFSRIFMLNAQNNAIRISPFITRGDTTFDNVDEVKNLTSVTPIEKLFLLYKNNLPEFKEIEEKFKAIFPFVEAVGFTTGLTFSKSTYPVLQIKEKNIDEWIGQRQVSSGMFQTLSHLAAMTLAQEGDVILIDEFENSLGVNCIEDVADMVVYPEIDLQFVVTSHHPYVINNIDFSKWKIVTRKGSDVSVYNATDLHIGKHSKHDAFMQLIQTSAYKTGIL